MDRINDKNKVIFIIAHKYFRGYESYVEYYIQNIQRFYQDSLVLVVDNNSVYKDEIFNNLKKYTNVILLDNNGPSKFEIGAYQIGIKYLMDNNLVNNYNYIVLSQDNFIIKNRIDFNTLHEQEITACPINSYHQDGDFQDISNNILTSIGLLNNLDKITFCWCSSFIIATEKCVQLYEYIKDIIITVRIESCAGERYLARILWELNNYKNNDIDGDKRSLWPGWNSFLNLTPKYDCHSVNPYDNSITTFFVKRTQHKTETTQDR